MKTITLLKSSGIALLLAALMSSGIGTAFGAYDIDYGPADWPGHANTYVQSAVQGTQSGSYFTSIEFWSYSYIGPYFPGAWIESPLYCTWTAGEYWFITTGDWSTSYYGFDNVQDSGLINHQCTWAQCSSQQEFAHDSGDNHHHWTYSCTSRIQL